MADEILHHKRAIEALLKKDGGYEIVSRLLQENKTQSELAAETGSPKSTTNEWLESANKVGLVSHDSVTVSDNSDGVVSVLWKLNKNQISPELAKIIHKRTIETESGVERNDHANNAGKSIFTDDYDFDQALYGSEHVNKFIRLDE